MPASPRAFLLAAALIVSAAASLRAAETDPCAAFSASDTVFVGLAQEPVRRLIANGAPQPVDMVLTPIVVERTYVGVTAPIMYLTPLGIRSDAAPGQRYLVYGRAYVRSAPDVVMASPGINAKNVEQAADDVAFLEAVAGGAAAGRLSGIVLRTMYGYGSTDGTVEGGVGGIRVTVTSDGFSTTVLTDDRGRFAVDLPGGVYRVIPELPDDLTAADPPSQRQVVLRAGGCATTKVMALVNGRVSGVLRTADGRPARRLTVDLVPADVEPDSATAQTRGSVSVDTNLHGEFVFTGRPPGRYHLGVGLRRGPRPAQAFPATYFPGTTDRREAVPVTVELGRPAEGFDFFLPPALPRGVLAVTITGGGAGEASICLTPLERQSTRSTQLAPRDRPADVAVVSGLRYEIHAHLRSRDGRHLESKRRTFTARMGRVPMTLTLDAPLELHP